MAASRQSTTKYQFLTGSAMQIVKQSEAIPERFLGIDVAEIRLAWRILVVGVIGLSVAPSVVFLYSFGSLTLPLQSAFGWSRPQQQLALSFFFGGVIVAFLVVGWINRRWGMRRITILSLIGTSIIWGLFPFIGHSIWWLYALAFVAPIVGMGTQQLTWSNLVVLWFERNRGLALSVIFCGTALTASVYPPVLAWLINRWNWQIGFAFLATVPIVIVLPLTLRWFRVPGEVPREPSSAALAEARGAQFGLSYADGVRTTRYWVLVTAISLASAASLSMVSFAVPLLRDKGFSAVDAAAIVSAYGIAVLTSRPLVGYLVDRLWAPAVLSFVILLPALACALLANSSHDEPTMLVVAMVLLGIGTGAEADTAAYLVSRYFGTCDFGRLFGTLASCSSFACMLAPLLFSRMYASTGGYTSSLIVCAAFCIAATALLLTLGRYPKFHRSTFDGDRSMVNAT
jgi:MFS family permease